MKRPMSKILADIKSRKESLKDLRKELEQAKLRSMIKCPNCLKSKRISNETCYQDHRVVYSDWTEDRIYYVCGNCGHRMTFYYNDPIKDIFKYVVDIKCGLIPNGE